MYFSFFFFNGKPGFYYDFYFFLFKIAEQRHPFMQWIRYQTCRRHVSRSFSVRRKSIPYCFPDQEETHSHRYRLFTFIEYKVHFLSLFCLIYVNKEMFSNTHTGTTESFKMFFEATVTPSLSPSLFQLLL